VAAVRQQLLDAAAPVEPDGVDETLEPAAAKRPRMDYDDPFGCLEALLEADPVGVSRPTSVEEEIAAYLDQPPIPRTSCVRSTMHVGGERQVLQLHGQRLH